MPHLKLNGITYPDIANITELHGDFLEGSSDAANEILAKLLRIKEKSKKRGATVVVERKAMVDAKSRQQPITNSRKNHFQSATNRHITPVAGKETEAEKIRQPITNSKHNHYKNTANRNTNPHTAASNSDSLDGNRDDTDEIISASLRISEATKNTKAVVVSAKKWGKAPIAESLNIRETHKKRKAAVFNKRKARRDATKKRKAAAAKNRKATIAYRAYKAENGNKYPFITASNIQRYFWKDCPISFFPIKLSVATQNQLAKLMGSYGSLKNMKSFQKKTNDMTTYFLNKTIDDILTVMLHFNRKTMRGDDVNFVIDNIAKEHEIAQRWSMEKGVVKNSGKEDGIILTWCTDKRGRIAHDNMEDPCDDDNDYSISSVEDDNDIKESEPSPSKNQTFNVLQTKTFDATFPPLYNNEYAGWSVKCFKKLMLDLSKKRLSRRHIFQEPLKQKTCTDPPSSRPPISSHTPQKIDVSENDGGGYKAKQDSLKLLKVGKRRAKFGDKSQGFCHHQIHRVNNMTTGESYLTEEEAKDMLATVKHLTKDNAGGLNNISELRCKLYSQVRVFQFLKFGMSLPPQLGKQCGAVTLESIICEHLAEDGLSKGLISAGPITHDSERKMSLKQPQKLPDLLSGEYDANVPITSNGLMMKVRDLNGSTVFIGYRLFPDGSMSSAQEQLIVKNVGDKIIAINGVSTVEKSFEEVINMLKDNGNNKYARIRFVSGKCNCNLTSMGMLGRFVVSEIKGGIRSERRQLLVKRGERSNGSVDLSETIVTNHSNDVVGNFDNVCDDEDLVIRQKECQNVKMKQLESILPSPSVKHALNSDIDKHQASDTPIHSNKKVVEGIIYRQETTQSLALRLLDADIGYSSDEAGDEDCAYFIDGVDNTFTTQEEARSFLGLGNTYDKLLGNKEEQENISVKSNKLHAKKKDFASLGERAKLLASIILSNQVPDHEDFDNYPLSSTKNIEAVAEKEACEKKSGENKLGQEIESSESIILSATKVEQISIKTNEVIHIWTTAEDAAAALQIPLKDIKQILSGIYNKDIGEEARKYRWRYTLEDAEVSKSACTSKEMTTGNIAFLELDAHSKLCNNEIGNPPTPQSTCSPKSSVTSPSSPLLSIMPVSHPSTELSSSESLWLTTDELKTSLRISDKAVKTLQNALLRYMVQQLRSLEEEPSM